MSYADNALTNGLNEDGQPTSSEQRMLQSLVNPTLQGGMPTQQSNKVNAARMRYGMAQLTALNIGNVQKWLEATAEKNPAMAVQLFLQLAEFSMPKLKAVAVDVRSGDGSVKTMSISELQNLVQSE